MAMQSKAWMITFLFKKFLSFFKRSIPSGISTTNKHLLILDGSHVTLEAIEQAPKFGLDMIILRSFTFHALQPLDVVLFKPFKIAFKKEIDITMVGTNYIEPDKISLARWVKKALDLTFIRKNIMSRFKGIGIWPFTLGLWIQKLALVFCAHCRIKLGKKNQNKRIVNKTR
jgi:hypothetical protein